MERAGMILRKNHPGLLASKQRLRQLESVLMVRLKRASAAQSLGFASRPFVLCGLPVKRPAKGVLLHECRNGEFLLQVTRHLTYGLPWGQDRRAPIFLATLAIRQQQRAITFPSGRHAEYLRHAAGRFPVPPADQRLPTDFRRGHLLRLR